MPGRFRALLSGMLVVACGCATTRTRENADSARPVIATPGDSARDVFRSVAPALADLVAEPLKGRYSFYIEDLESGQWLGFGDEELFEGWSLLKVSVMATILKKAARHEISIEDSTALSGPGYGRGAEVAIRELLERMIKLSDNGASLALSKYFTAAEFYRDLRAMADENIAAPMEAQRPPAISPRQFGNLLNSLYRGDYLGSEMSTYALELLSGTVYDSQLRRGVPSGTRVAHKVGFNADAGDFHDCGIVFLPHRPYILCVMSSNNTRAEADAVIGRISRIVYDNFAKQQ